MNMIHEKSKSKTRRERKRAARSEEILAAAMGIVVADNIDSLKMPALARQLDCAVGALYRYFPGKDALIVGLQLRAIGEFSEFLNEVLRPIIHHHDPGEAAMQRLRNGFVAFRDFEDRSPAAYGLIDAMLSDPRALLDDDDARAVQQVLDPILARFGSLLDEAVELGVLTPGDSLLRTHVIWAALHGAAHFRKRDPRQPESLASNRVAEEALNTLLSGWGARSWKKIEDPTIFVNE